MAAMPLTSRPLHKGVGLIDCAKLAYQSMPRENAAVVKGNALNTANPG
jgi:hypothetical protein